jgi:ubiquinone/menaquinone biosynthesis C-methylase UbiE
MSGERRAELIARYRDPASASSYLADRFGRPLQALLHDRQSAAAADAMRRSAGGLWLDAASGPGRFRGAAERAGARVVHVDSSLAMLRRAGAPAVAGDAHVLPLPAGRCAGALCFRFLRHLGPTDRAAAFAELARVLAPGASLLFDAVNRAQSAPLRARSPQDYPLFDQLYSLAQLREEIETSPFAWVSARGVQHRYPIQLRLQVLLGPRLPRLARLAIEAVERWGGGQPLEWIVECRRR